MDISYFYKQAIPPFQQKILTNKNIDKILKINKFSYLSTEIIFTNNKNNKDLIKRSYLYDPIDQKDLFLDL